MSAVSLPRVCLELQAGLSVEPARRQMAAPAAEGPPCAAATDGATDGTLLLTLHPWKSTQQESKGP